MHSVQREIAQAAAPWVLEHGMDYASAKRQARDALGLPQRTALPDNTELDAALRDHIRLFLNDTQPQELRALRELARAWMLRLAPFRPHLSGAVFNGTATRHSPLSLQLFCDDPKLVDMWLLNERVPFDLDEATGAHGGQVVRLTFYPHCAAIHDTVPLSLWVHDADDLRRAKKANAAGEPLRGNLRAVDQLLADVHD